MYAINVNAYFCVLDPTTECGFNDQYICGYSIIGESFTWNFIHPADIAYGLAPKTDSNGSVLG